LHAIDALGIDGADLEFVGVALNTKFFEGISMIFGREVLEDALIEAVCR